MHFNDALLQNMITQLHLMKWSSPDCTLLIIFFDNAKIKCIQYLYNNIGLYERKMHWSLLKTELATANCFPTKITKSLDAKIVNGLIPSCLTLAVFLKGQMTNGLNAHLDIDF